MSYPQVARLIDEGKMEEALRLFLSLAEGCPDPELATIPGVPMIVNRLYEYKVKEDHGEDHG